MPRIKKPYKRHFTVIDNTVIDDPDIDFKAKGLFLFMWHLPENWNFNISYLTKVSKDGRDAVMSGLDELENAGYLSRSRNRTKTGQFSSDNTWLLSEFPNGDWIKQFKNRFNPENSDKPKEDKSTTPKSENPTLAKSTLGNPTLLNTDVNKYLYNKVLNSSLSKSPSKIRIVDKAPAKQFEREQKANQVYLLLNQKRMALTNEPLIWTDAQYSTLAQTIGDHSVDTIKQLIPSAAEPMVRNPLAYLISMIRQLPAEEVNSYGN